MIYDRFQQEAIDYINAGHSVIVSAPTGAGKTAIAEHVIGQCLKQGSKVIYTAPIKALSNQKYREFQESSPDLVGILTGDITLNPHAPVLIMTTEIFRNKILEENSSLADYSWIIFDEIHYLDDYERGSVWEESLIFLPDHMRFLGLSATVPNIDQISSWLESIHNRPVKIVTEENRPVPLHFYFQCQGKIYDDLKTLAKDGYHSPEWRYRGAGRLPRHTHVRANRLHPLIGHLQENDMLPCIYFAFSRKLTEQLAAEIMDFQFLDEQQRLQVAAMYDELCKKFDLQAEESAHELKPFIERGIAYHHAGMLPTLKEVVERLFTSRQIKAIFTTETFALGINMPAKTVIFDELRKYYGRAFATLKTRDFYQMAGRAGRRSIDTEGHVFSRVNPHYIAPEELHSIIYSQPEKVQSQFNASYATILNLYQHYGERLYDIYPRSFHFFQVRKHLRKRAVNLMRAKVAILKEMQCIHRNRLTKKGEFAAKVYGYEMILSELYYEGFLEQLSVMELGILCIAVVFEPRKGAHKPPLDRKSKALEAKAEKVIHGVNRMERAAGMKDLSKHCAFHLSPAMEAWIRGAPFRDILKHTNSDEGEIVRYLRMTIQVLREIAETPVTDELRSRIYQLIGAINRDVVDSEKQLRG